MRFLLAAITMLSAGELHAQARDWVQRVERALQFGEDLLRRLRKAL